MVHATHAVLVVRVRQALDLFVRLFRGGWCGLARRPDDVHVPVQTRRDPILELLLRDVVHLGRPLRRVKASRRERDQHVVDRHELRAGSTQPLVVPELEILRATQRELRQQLLLLIPEFDDLLGQLPIHEVAFALGTIFGFLVVLPDHLRAHGAIGRE